MPRVRDWLIQYYVFSTARRADIFILLRPIKISFNFTALTSSKRFEEDGINHLITYVDQINASGGRDCPEYSFEGMVSALYESP